MMRTAQEQLEGNIRFLTRVSVLQKLPEPKDHVLAKISDLIKVVSEEESSLDHLCPQDMERAHFLNECLGKTSRVRRNSSRLAPE